MENSFGPQSPAALVTSVKRAVAVVVKQMALAERGDEDVVVAVVVVIADGDAESEHGTARPALRGHIGESSVVIVVIELGRGGRHWGGRASPRR